MIIERVRIIQMVLMTVNVCMISLVQSPLKILNLNLPSNLLIELWYIPKAFTLS